MMQNSLRRGFLLVMTLLLLSGPAHLFSFSGEDMDRLLEMDHLTRGVALSLIEEGAASRPDAAHPEALDLFREREASGEVSLGEFSYMVMKAFSLKGGILYSLFPSGRYASRELGYKGFIRGDYGAYRKLSGTEALGILGRVLNSLGGRS